MSKASLPARDQAEIADLESGEVVICHIVPSAATFWSFQAALALIALVGAINLVDPTSTGLGRMLWCMLVFGAAYHVYLDMRMKPNVLTTHWQLTNRRLIGPSVALALKDIRQVSSFLHEVRFTSEKGGKRLIKYQANAASTVAQIKAAVTAAKEAAV